ncbi:hypothetical protein QBK99_24315 [Corticibacterium sp. UT-5YL-CI-8]|nr:hypothetical protein [Tianweitania sp. UT-5YL-CI-8]
MTVTIEKHFFEGNGRIPNSRLPLLIYRNVIRWDVSTMEAIMRQNKWIPSWHAHDGMWPRHHFHSEAHEFICVTRGVHTGNFGGHNGIYSQLNAGDVVVIPAGVGHRGLQVSDDLDLTGGFHEGFGVVDFRMGFPEEYYELTIRAREIPLIDYDPFFGVAGPLAKIWKDADSGVRRLEPELYAAESLSKLC